MQRIIIFGASLGGQRALKSLPRKAKAVAFSDNDPKKHGQQLDGLPIVSPDEIKSQPFDTVLIASSYYPQIFNQLIDLGIPLDSIEILDADILSGVEEPSSNIYGAFAGIAVVLALAAYGLFRLIAGIFPL